MELTFYSIIVSKFPHEPQKEAAEFLTIKLISANIDSPNLTGGVNRQMGEFLVVAVMTLLWAELSIVSISILICICDPIYELSLLLNMFVFC